MPLDSCLLFSNLKSNLLNGEILFFRILYSLNLAGAGGEFILGIQLDQSSAVGCKVSYDGVAKQRSHLLE